MIEPSDHLIADQALKVVEAVRRRKDIDAVQLGLLHANEAVASLEASFDRMMNNVTGWRGGAEVSRVNSNRTRPSFATSSDTTSS